MPSVSDSLTDRYLAELARHLPRRQRDDIVREVRGAIDDLAAEEYGHLPAAYAEREALRTLGDPADLATRYYDSPRQVVRPENYRAWVSLCTLSAWLGVAVFAVTFTADGFRGPENWLRTLGETAAQGVITWLSLTAVCTLVLHASDRRRLRAFGSRQDEKPWTPEALPEVSRPYGLGEHIADLILLGLFLPLILNAILQESPLTLQLGDGAAISVFNSMFLTVFLPVLLVHGVLEMGLAVWAIARRTYTLHFTIVSIASCLVGCAVFAVALSNPTRFLVTPAFATELLAQDFPRLFLSGNLAVGYLVILGVAIGVPWFSWRRYRRCQEVEGALAA
ncbi:hypothetical protein JT358_05160 [Micrococcales bacterium 31B]|nr:hypothetical protein [Micrococcales bacterium 31B]